MPGNDFWRRRRIFVTGHTGFKGAWLCFWLERLGAQVTGFALPPEDQVGAFALLAPCVSTSVIADLRNDESVRKAVCEAAPEIIFHLGAQPLVRRAYSNPTATYETNILGTLHVLEAAAEVGAAAVVVATSDKVYQNDGSGHRFHEGDRLGGNDPYSTSKACAELVTATWSRSAPTIAAATARAGNVIGGGDRGEDRLLPDAWKALERGTPLEIRYPAAVRPWQFVLDPLYGYMLLAKRLVETPSEMPPALNFGPGIGDERSVEEVLKSLFSLWGSGSWQTQPGFHPHEASVLRLDATKAAETLGWVPRVPLEEALAWTVDWWRAAEDGRDVREIALAQLKAYEERVALSQ